MKATSAKRIIWLASLKVVMLGYFLTSLHNVPAQNVIPPFVAEGRLLTQEFRTDTNSNYRTDASVTFLYSNGWWQVEARYSYLHRTSGITNVENCMKIPDGIRSYIIFEGSTNRGVTTMATACPIVFPPPGRSLGWPFVRIPSCR